MHLIVNWVVKLLVVRRVESGSVYSITTGSTHRSTSGSTVSILIGDTANITVDYTVVSSMVVYYVDTTMTYVFVYFNNLYLNSLVVL